MRNLSLVVVTVFAALASACDGGTLEYNPTPPPSASVSPDATGSPLSSGATDSAAAVSPSIARSTAPATVVVRYRIERRTTDSATAGFGETVVSTLTDPRGWSRAGFRLIEDPAAEYRVVLAEAAEVDALCRPYDTYGTYSCQNGPVVALNADRWRRATPEWTGDLATYRQMLVNHEVGHLLGQHHPPNPQCPRPGRPALVMSQQSTELNGCTPNPWPLPEEIARAARHDEPLAPPYEG